MQDMELYILRHSDAVNIGESGCASDRERFLSETGRLKMEEIAQSIKKMGIEFDLVLSSPYVRARQTAEILVKAYHAEKKLRFSDFLASGESVEDLMAELDEKYSRLEALVLVGHEPQLSRLISFLLSGHEDLGFEMKKGGLCKLSIERFKSKGACAVLDWLLPPRYLRLMVSL